MADFAALHHRELPLLLPNAWDVASALLFVEAGFAAIGTTSFGVAAAAGSPDASRATAQATIDLARELTASVPVPVSVDIEDGYSDDPAEVAAYVEVLAGLGVAGVNLEDSTAGRLVPPEAHAAKIAAVKAAAPGVFLNARPENYWLDREASVEAVLRRAVVYVEAGADGFFVPGLSDSAEIETVAAAVPAPLNLLAQPGRTLRELADLGVRRVSTGSLPYRAAMRSALAVAKAVRDGSPVPDAVPYADLQRLLESR